MSVLTPSIISELDAKDIVQTILSISLVTYMLFRSKIINRADVIEEGSFDSEYKRGKRLGAGAFSIVIDATKKGTTNSYAVKSMDKSKMTKQDSIALQDEIQILNELRHNNIIRLYNIYSEAKHFFLVTEKMNGGELFDRIVAKTFYSEKEARDVVKILFEAIDYCHDNQVAHRDLKPENLLLLSKDDDSQLKIADFGFAKKAPSENCLTTMCGTPGYVSPEVLSDVAYGTKSDMWSLGVIIYILLGGYPPFTHDNNRMLFHMIRKGQFEFHEDYWGNISDDAKDLIKCLLTVDPSKRISANDALKHKWIVQDGNVLKDSVVNLSELRVFNAKRKFKAAAKAVIAINRASSVFGDIEPVKMTHRNPKFKTVANAVIAVHKMSSLGVDFKQNLE
eukprot:CAMPEP_0183746236 /NCGR_PEP_ID=MMETSP0737-20130205/66651_1 /TAXON_ID=385413 /ORGANISM="Thalassiosira miniscula, Strain CCMP1093" /LENGTH=392 /DNA_ID=CAMNT_0025981923 /DNA_START=514 /DNA_END=1692 /DNA_ORIENTATION=-